MYIITRERTIISTLDGTEKLIIHFLITTTEVTKENTQSKAAQQIHLLFERKRKDQIPREGEAKLIRSILAILW